MTGVLTVAEQPNKYTFNVPEQQRTEKGTEFSDGDRFDLHLSQLQPASSSQDKVPDAVSPDRKGGEETAGGNLRRVELATAWLEYALTEEVKSGKAA